MTYYRPHSTFWGMSPAGFMPLSKLDFKNVPKTLVSLETWSSNSVLGQWWTRNLHKDYTEYWQSKTPKQDTNVK